VGTLHEWDPDQELIVLFEPIMAKSLIGVVQEGEFLYAISCCCRELVICVGTHWACDGCGDVLTTDDLKAWPWRSKEKIISNTNVSRFVAGWTRESVAARVEFE
jgi:hypothetical protein